MKIKVILTLTDESTALIKEKSVLRILREGIVKGGVVKRILKEVNHG